jgi:hypothetical protein
MKGALKGEMSELAGVLTPIRLFALKFGALKFDA